MKQANLNKGPWTHRLAVWVFTTAFGVLIIWALGFVLQDIGKMPGPNYDNLQVQFMDEGALNRASNLQKSITDIEIAQADLKAQQTVLRDSTSESQRTMNQLIDFQRFNLKQDLTPSEKEQQTLAESQQLFLANQKQYQALNQQIAQRGISLSEMLREQRVIDDELAEKRTDVEEEYARLVERNNLKIAGIKLTVLLPLILVTAWLFGKSRSSTYKPMVYAIALAMAYHTILVMHQYLPSIVFRYMLAGTCLLVAGRILYSLLRMVANPQQDWLLKQYRDAYERFLCPVCDYPVRRGPREFLYWTRRTVHKMALPQYGTDETESAYTCPMCSTTLFEECSSCRKARHALLPACSHCGDVKSV